MCYSAVADLDDTASLVHSGMFYVLEGVMPFLEVLKRSKYHIDALNILLNQ